MPSNQQHAIVVSANGALTLPDTIDVVPVQLGVAAYTDGHAIAQHGADFSYVTGNSPAKPSEVRRRRERFWGRKAKLPTKLGQKFR